MHRHPRSGLILALLVVLGFQGSAGPVAPKGLIGDFHWRGEGPLFGGFSAIHMAPDGMSFVALSDHGAWIAAQVRRDADGRIAGVTNGPVTLLLGNGDAALAEDRTDSEGMAIGADGAMFVSFEGPARVLRYDRPGASAVNLPVIQAFRAMGFNSSLESLALDAQGTLYTIPERSGAPARPFPIYRFRDGSWDQPFSISRSGEFLVSDATIGPDDRLYVLERAFLGLAGFETRLRRFAFIGDRLSDGEILLQTPSGTHDNLEGISVWRDGKGVLRATMVSDNNYLFVLRTELVEYALPD